MPAQAGLTAGRSTRQLRFHTGTSRGRAPVRAEVITCIGAWASTGAPALAGTAASHAQAWSTLPLVIGVAGALVGAAGLLWGLLMRSRARRHAREAHAARGARDAALRELQGLSRAQTQRERLAEVMDCTTDFVGAFEADLRLRWVNKAGLVLVGLAPERAHAATCADIMPAWACERLKRDAIPAALEQGTWSGESALLGDGGRVVPVSLVLLAHCEEGSGRERAGLISMVARDISVHKQTEHSLLESRQRLELITAAATQINAGTEPRRVITQVVEQLARVFPQHRVRFCAVTAGAVLTVDYSLEPTAREAGPGLPALQGMAADLSAAPEYLAQLRSRGPVAVSDAMRDPRLKALRTFLEAGAIGATLSHAVTTGGVEGLLAFDAPSPHDWTEHETAALSEMCDYLAMAVSGARGVQDRLNAEERLRRSEERLALIIENMPVLAFAISSLGRIVFWNKEAQRVTGYSAQEIVGDPLGLEKLLPDPAYRGAVMTAWGVGPSAGGAA